jgi:REP element-mobilizing transposase RayT
MAFYYGRLPHWTPEGKNLFVTWRLHGSLPSHRYVPPQGLSSGHAFVWLDRYLDLATQGPTWLRQPDIAAMVVEALHYGDRVLNHYRLHAWVVMPNHVHLLISPLSELAKIMHSVKGFTARRANHILGRAGLPFWQKEFFDHWIRYEREFERVRAYIEANPVVAGLSASAEEYPWSSATSAKKQAGREAGSPARLPAPL